MAKQHSFTSILDQTITDDGSWERPQPVPVGTYVAIVKSYRQDKSPQKQTEYVEFTLQLIEAQKDVDKEDLKEMGGIKEKLIRDKYYNADGARWRLKQFFLNCGLEPDHKSVSQNAEDAINQTILVRIVHTPSEDGTVKFATVKSTAKYDG